MYTHSHASTIADFILFTLAAVSILHLVPLLQIMNISFATSSSQFFPQLVPSQIFEFIEVLSPYIQFHVLTDADV